MVLLYLWHVSLHSVHCQSGRFMYLSSESYWDYCIDSWIFSQPVPIIFTMLAIAVSIKSTPYWCFSISLLKAWRPAGAASIVLKSMHGIRHNPTKSRNSGSNCSMMEHCMQRDFSCSPCCSCFFLMFLTCLGSGWLVLTNSSTKKTRDCPAEKNSSLNFQHANLLLQNSANAEPGF